MNSIKTWLHDGSLRVSCASVVFRGTQSKAILDLGLALAIGRKGNKANQKWDLKMLWHESAPFTWRTVAVLVPVHARWIIAALNGTSGERLGVGQWRWGGGCRRAQEPVQTATTVLKRCPLLFLAKYFNAHRLKHPRVHQGLTESDSLVARHCLIAKETVQGDVRQHHIHSLGAQEAVMVGLEVVSPPLDFHVSVEIGDDAAPDVGGPERLPSHALFWWKRGESQWMEVGSWSRSDKL